MERRHARIDHSDGRVRPFFLPLSPAPRVLTNLYLVVISLWDNRVLSHTAVVDFVNIEGNSRRHGARISPQAEVPIAARDSKAE